MSSTNAHHSNRQTRFHDDGRAPPLRSFPTATTHDFELLSFSRLAITTDPAVGECSNQQAVAVTDQLQETLAQRFDDLSAVLQDLMDSQQQLFEAYIQARKEHQQVFGEDVMAGFHICEGFHQGLEILDRCLTYTAQNHLIVSMSRMRDMLHQRIAENQAIRDDLDRTSIIELGKEPQGASSVQVISSGDDHGFTGRRKEDIEYFDTIT